VALVVVGLNAGWETEGEDRLSLSLPGSQDELIERVAEANPRTVVVVNAGSPVAMPWAGRVGAVLHCWYPGQEAGDAIADVVLGDRDPAGRLACTFPVRLEDSPAHLTYPGEAGSVVYGEGIFTGYRGFLRRAVEPGFPFGHGLSYTTFSLGAPEPDAGSIKPGEGVSVKVPVTNTGAVAGTVVVQLYVRDVKSSLLRPERELKGFGKFKLQAGERREVEIVLGPRAFAAWDPRVRDWVVEPGEFRILAGTSVSDIRGDAEITVLGDGP